MTPLLDPRTWWTLPGAPPLHATQRDPAYPTEGRRVGLIADALGKPFLPWQQYSADVAGELNPDGSYRYPVVVVTVPRQSGKTTLMRAVGVDRAIARGAGVFYTAQTGKDARERWQDLVIDIKASPLKTMATVRQAAGAERVVFANGGMFRCFAPSSTSLHGYTPPLVMLDEAFAHDEQTGDDLMGAIGPAQITIPHRQLWIVSTKGTAESVFLNRWLEAGRAGADGVAILEWAAGPDVVDIYDPDVWPTFHPGMVEVDGFQLVNAEAIRSEAERLPRSEFERAYGNRSTRTASHLIPAEVWDALTNHDQRSPDQLPASSVVFAWDVMHDRSAAALIAAWYDGAGQLQARVTRTGIGMGWVAPAVAQLHSWGWRAFAAADNGPSREVTDELERTVPGISIRRLAEREYVDAWGFLMQHIAHRTMHHDGSESLALAAANVATRPRADGSAPSRRNSAGDVTPVVALMVAAWWIDHRPGGGALDFRFASDGPAA